MYCLSTSLYFPTLRSQIPLALCFRTPSVCVLPLQIHSKRTSSVVERYRSGFEPGRCPLRKSPFILTVKAEVSYGFFFSSSSFSSSSPLKYDPYSLTSVSTEWRPMHLSSDLFLHTLEPIDFRSLSIQSNHLNFGLAAFLLPSVFPRNTLLTALSSDILTRWPAISGFLTCIGVAVLGFLYVTYSSSLVRIVHPFDLLLGHISCLVFSAPVF